MHALKGYYNGKNFVIFDKINVRQNQKVIITVLDEYIDAKEASCKPYKKFIGILSTQSCEEIEKAIKDCEKVDADEW